MLKTYFLVDGFFNFKDEQEKAKPEPIWTIEYIEQDYWGDEAPYNSHLVTTIYKLRKKNLEEFTPEDLRIVIGQNFSLPILIPKAIDRLEKDILAEGDFYPGDLLKNVLTITPKFWSDYPELKIRLKNLFAKNQQRIKHNAYLSDQQKDRLFELYNDFKIGKAAYQNIFDNYKPL